MSQSAFEVLEAGFLTTVQDAGRTGYRRFGMPLSGAMDQYALAVGNTLLGNLPGDAAVECTVVGPSLRFRQTTWFSVTGADCLPTLNGRPVPTWQACLAPEGSTLALGAATQGTRVYVAVRGGVDVQPFMGSRSTCTIVSVGGFKGRPLQPGDIVPVGPPAFPPGALPEDTVVPLPDGWSPRQYAGLTHVRVVLGPQDYYFTEEAKATLLSSPYDVTTGSNRMGYRLNGPPLTHIKGADIVSDGTPFGGIQVPGHGQPIVLMADCQTTGGYSKIACVTSSDLPLLAQAKPGDSITFSAVTVAEAHEERRRMMAEIGGLRKAIAANGEARRGNARRLGVRIRGRQYGVLIEPRQDS